MLTVDIVLSFQSAVQKMTDVAKHIDAMKREYDMAVRVEKIQSLIQGDWTGLDLTKYGDLVLEVGEMVLV